MLFSRLWTPPPPLPAPSASPAPKPSWRRRSAARRWRSTRRGAAARSRPQMALAVHRFSAGAVPASALRPDLWARPQDVPVAARMPDARQAGRAGARAVRALHPVSRCPSRRSLPGAATDRARLPAVSAGEPRHVLLALRRAQGDGAKRGDVMGFDAQDRHAMARRAARLASRGSIGARSASRS